MTPSATLLALAAAAASWLAAIVYSRSRYPWLGCRACGGTGKRLEPLALTVLCLRLRRRAWRPCGACNGAAKHPRKRGLRV